MSFLPFSLVCLYKASLYFGLIRLRCLDEWQKDSSQRNLDEEPNDIGISFRFSYLSRRFRDILEFLRTFNI